MHFKKRLIIATCFFAFFLNVANATPGKTYSQRTYTLFADGHYERRTCYTDGSCDKLEQGPFHKPQKGDLKHREEVWRNGRWEATVSQYY
jgi:hypothetical protein